MRSPSFAFATASSVGALVLACHVSVESSPPPAAPVAPPPAAASAPVAVAPPAPAPAPLPVPVPAPAPDAGATAVTASTPDAGADFYACTTNADCVAVAKVGCCHNGHLEAVAQGSADAYAKSFVCGEAHPICPQHIVNDVRVPRCSPSLHKCEMVGKGVFVK